MTRFWDYWLRGDEYIRPEQIQPWWLRGLERQFRISSRNSLEGLEFESRLVLQYRLSRVRNDAANLYKPVSTFCGLYIKISKHCNPLV